VIGGLVEEIAMTSCNPFSSGKVALITGGAVGIGRAVAKKCAASGMSVVLVDIRDADFAEAGQAVRDAGAADVMTVNADVADRSAVDAMRDEVFHRFGRVDFLMCNAGIQPGSDIFDASNTWQRVMDVNLGGVVNCCQSIVPLMADGGTVICTGSKQGITTPPGDPAYNTSKAGVKVFTEALCHQLRESGSAVSVHLLIPGFVFADINRRGRAEKPDGAWTPDELADFMMERLALGDFYILCPDNEVTREIDEKRMVWAAGDIINNRPPLSRWHAGYRDAFADYMHGDAPVVPSASPSWRSA